MLRTAVIAVAVLLLAGCDPTSAAPDPAAPDPAAPVAAAAFAPPGPPGPPARPGTGVRVAVPERVGATGSTSTASATPSSTWPAASPSVSPEVAAGPCPPLYGPGTPVPMTVTPGIGSARLNWWHNGDPAMITYWIGVQRQTSLSGGPVTWVRLPPPVGCRFVAYTVTGLSPANVYTIFLDLEATTPAAAGGITRVTLKQVGGVVPR